MWLSRVIRLMGRLRRTENSLNQHIKLKHQEFWKQLKDDQTSRKDSDIKGISEKPDEEFD